ncbi:hypothetical protein J2Z69_002841 [Paenibacillus shirakamiensis]|uniref:Glycosyltransferase 2-like domain-containing protein n=1 Tax=Paenibacillus shirakamiensis TaxID=1265935 RepID=A0ABS4JJB2_9BACL|nr:hypothetical protein [Paenibacillus shirakamiensis]MBP2001785.1 hypothetical protein [Paenibacillus shirakamiensis]
MVPLWIIACYGLATLVVHWVHVGYIRRQAAESQFEHFILVTHNHGQQMEWYLRAISWYGQIRGRNCRITVLDEGSEDDTVAITERMRDSSEMELQVIGITAEPSEDIRNQADWTKGHKACYIDLRLPMEAAKIPYV